MLRANDILFVDFSGASIISRSGRLYVRHRNEYTEVAAAVRVIIASGFGFVITSDAIGVCVKRHVEIIITDYAQSFTAIHAPYAPCSASRSSLAKRLRQFAAIADRRKTLLIARDIIRRKVMVEHRGQVRLSFLSDLARCKTVDAIRHVEARSAQEWWRQWKDFEVNFERGYKPPEQWRTFQTKYIGRPQGRVGELPRQFTARFAETPLQALHNFTIGIVVARLTRVIAVHGLDCCYGFLHNGRKPGRLSLAWDAIEVFRPVLTTAVFDYSKGKVFERADFATQDGVVRLSSWIAKECANLACHTVPLAMMTREVKKIEKLL